MYKRLNELSFVIGLFFLIVSLIVALNGLLNEAANNRLTYYSAAGFFIFSIFMLLTKSKED